MMSDDENAAGALTCKEEAEFSTSSGSPKKHHSSFSPISVLHLRKDVLLSGGLRLVTYNVIYFMARLMPAIIIYGGTLGLLVCAFSNYRWGLMLSLTLFSLYNCCMCFAFVSFAAVGVMHVWINSKEQWYMRYCQEQERRLLSTDVRTATPIVGEHVDWHDVLHIVMVPNYKTPVEVLEETLGSLQKFSLAKSNMAIVLAFEERESHVQEKASSLKEKWEKEFKFIFCTFHPPDLPNHVPGKSSNECWAFQQLQQELEDAHDISRVDPRVIITVIDDDSEMHENYFEALTYKFVSAPRRSRYITTWQPPICHFKNYLRQPVIVRISSLFATLSELACLANPVDCHVNYSSYSLSLMLASAVGGWDPDHLAEDWHMFAKCSLMTGGRVRCEPIFLPLMNYTPEEDTYWGSMVARWDQAKRHALGVSELVYVIQAIYLGMLETTSVRDRIMYVYQLLPLLGKFTQVHFVNGMGVVMTVLGQLVIHFWMWRSWCYASANGEDPACAFAMASATQDGIAQEEIVLNSFLINLLQRVTICMGAVSILSGGFGAIYFLLVQDRVEGDVKSHAIYGNFILHWILVELQVTTFGLVSSIVYGAVPLWIAVSRVITEAKFTHVVAGMVGRSDLEV